MKQVEEYYKQGLVSTASLPRVLLLLYERLLRLLRQSLLDRAGARSHIRQAQTLLQQMLGLFLEVDETAYQALYLTHQDLLQELTLALNEASDDRLKACYVRLEQYDAAWKSQLQIIERRAPAADQLNVNRRYD